MHLMEPLEARALLSGAPHVVVSAGQLAFDQVAGTMTAPQTLTVRNTGRGRLAISSISVAGANAGQYVIRGWKGHSVTLGRGASMRVTVSFVPFTVGLNGATLQIATNDPAAPTTSVALRGLGLKGFYGDAEPSLQRILDTLQIPVNVGDATPDVRDIDGLGPSDEVPMQLMKKAGAGPVSVTPLAIFGWNTNPVATIGWYAHGASVTVHPLLSIPFGSGQSLAPVSAGAHQFDPGSASFGFYGNWPSEAHTTFSEDAFNTWYTINNQHAVRVYPYKTPSGQVVPNAYVVAMEQGADNDFQDAVLLIQNVMPAT